VSVRDTLVQLGYVMIAVGTCFATWAIFTGPLGKYTERFVERQSVKRIRVKRVTRETEADPKS
jgi:hypothetical protein